jgi:hypothetical protein
MLNSHQVKVYFSLNFFLLFFLVPINAHAAWYWVSVPTAPQTGYFIEEVSPNTIGYTGTGSGSYGDKTITPDGFMDVMDDTEDSNKCSAELDSAISQLRNFDSSKAIQPTGKCYGECGPYFTQETMTERESLLSKLKINAEQCLVKEEQAIQQAEEERKRKEAEERRLKEVAEAVADCDSDFFYNEMTDKERMETWEQREACKAKDVAETISEPVIKPSTPVITPTPAIQPTMLQTPVVTPLSNTPTATQAVGPEQAEETSSTPTTSSETIEQTESEADEAEVTVIPEPEKPTFFQRVIRFFTGWFK